MKIINKIEINYFRSIISISLNHTKDINVLIGGNDAGKSNILKALNLYFNNETDFYNEFDFYNDLSKRREQDARKAKGRATIWIRVTFNNFLNWNSLPDKFSIKKVWNRYYSSPSASDVLPKNIPPTTIAKFMNKIRFHYIPAVRSRDIFSYYLTLLHDALIDDEKAGIRKASQSLSNAINMSTSDMSSKIKSVLQLESNIKAPQNLRDLFSSLDFSTRFSEFDIPLQMRGDGIQARHIPFILNFVAQHSNQYHIWAYEEPENSLEMSNAYNLSKQFEDDFSNINQIFITTHSPAFYDLENNNTTKWLITSNKDVDNNDYATTAESIDKTTSADDLMGLTYFIYQRTKDLRAEYDSQTEALESLKKEITAINKPKIIVEGKTDKVILETALKRYTNTKEIPFSVISANGAANITHLINNLKRMDSFTRAPIIAIFDNDDAGRKEFKKFSDYSNFLQNKFIAVDTKKKLYVGLLPIPDYIKSVFKSIPKGNEIIPTVIIELLFSPPTIQEAISDKTISFNDRMVSENKGCHLLMPINLSDHYQPIVPKECLYIFQDLPDNQKVRFAEWTKNLSLEHFDNFIPLIEQLNKLMQ